MIILKWLSRYRGLDRRILVERLAHGVHLLVLGLLLAHHLLLVLGLLLAHHLLLVLRLLLAHHLLLVLRLLLLILNLLGCNLLLSVHLAKLTFLAIIRVVVVIDGIGVEIWVP